MSYLFNIRKKKTFATHTSSKLAQVKQFPFQSSTLSLPMRGSECVTEHNIYTHGFVAKAELTNNSASFWFPLSLVASTNVSSHSLSHTIQKDFWSFVSSSPQILLNTQKVRCWCCWQLGKLSELHGITTIAVSCSFIYRMELKSFNK